MFLFFLCFEVGFVLVKQWLQVYHVVEDSTITAMPFIPRFDDALVAEFIEDEAFTLEGRMNVFAGLHMGYDRRNTLQWKSMCCELLWCKSPIQYANMSGGICSSWKMWVTWPSGLKTEPWSSIRPRLPDRPVSDGPACALKMMNFHFQDSWKLIFQVQLSGTYKFIDLGYFNGHLFVDVLGGSWRFLVSIVDMVK